MSLGRSFIISFTYVFDGSLSSTSRFFDTSNSSARDVSSEYGFQAANISLASLRIFLPIALSFSLFAWLLSPKNQSAPPLNLRALAQLITTTSVFSFSGLVPFFVPRPMPQYLSPFTKSPNL